MTFVFCCNSLYYLNWFSCMHNNYNKLCCSLLMLEWGQSNGLLCNRDLNGLSLEGVLAPDLGKLAHLRIL